MYISELSINNFRGFSEVEPIIKFKEGINIIIGENNAGKTTVIKALEILFDSKTTKRLTINDFNRNIELSSLTAKPPKILISAKLVESKDEEAYSDELLTVANWLTKIETPYEARITFEFFLPDTEVETYERFMANTTFVDRNEYWKTLEQHFLKKYVARTFVGDPKLKYQINNSELIKFDFQFLTAIRDVERDLFKGNNTLLKDVIDFYMDYDIKSDETLDNNERIKKINDKKKEFNVEAKKIIEVLKQRMSQGENQILKYIDGTGAGISNSKPIFEGEILDTELYSALRLIVEKETGIKLPATNNGLGYNNLIFISILLSKMQRDASGTYLGSNAKTFSILAIEEPEAHLHPSMQYKFLQFLKKNNHSEVRQVFITSHSPNITAAVELEDIIILQKCLVERENDSKVESVRAAYPSKVFEGMETPEENLAEIKSSEYVRRFLDVTKADLFFAKNIILVEGIAEQLVIPQFAKNMDLSLEDNHTTIINIGGRYFNHFMKLFNLEKSEYALNKKVACITDLDPVRKKISDDANFGEEEVESGGWTKCLPLFLNKEDNYEYKETSNKLISDPETYSDNIKVFTQEIGLSSTFEYELIRSNYTKKNLITNTVSNQSELKELFDMVNNDSEISKMAQRLRRSIFKTELIDLIDSGKLNNDMDTKIAILASRYLMSINKGEAAQELAYLISECKNDAIIPPNYIREAIKWISQ